MSCKKQAGEDSRASKQKTAARRSKSYNGCRRRGAGQAKENGRRPRQ